MMRKTFHAVAAMAGGAALALAAPSLAQQAGQGTGHGQPPADTTSPPAGTMTPPGERSPEMPPTMPAPAETPPSEMPSPAPTTPGEGGAPRGDSTAPAPAPAEQPPLVTDAAQTVAANVVAAQQLSTLESAVIAAGLAETLAGTGPFTLFAPDDAAFRLIRAEALTALMEPANRAQLASLLQAHVVAGRVTAADLARQIEAGGGSATLQTVGGNRLTATREGDVILITGANNSRAYVTQADARASNGVIHIVNGVLLPGN